MDRSKENGGGLVLESESCIGDAENGECVSLRTTEARNTYSNSAQWFRDIALQEEVLGGTRLELERSYTSRISTSEM
jgi:hypothetical protein